ncbi:MAG: hypothetical protein KDG50_02375 [Chromatiales bacterium]|nr:hypothetical protein [Chromatiales bacterium]
MLYLDPAGGASERGVQITCPDKRTRLDAERIAFIEPLLRAQPYIEDVRSWNGAPVDYNLDRFREVLKSPDRRSRTGNLADCHLQAFDLAFDEVTRPWLDVDEPIVLGKNVIARSARVQGGFGWLYGNKHAIARNYVFVGLPKEHEYFEWTFDSKIAFHPTTSVLELARVIRGAPRFIGNSSFPLALAIGMGHPDITQEVDPKLPTTVFDNIRMQYI